MPQGSAKGDGAASIFLPGGAALKWFGSATQEKSQNKLLIKDSCSELISLKIIEKEGLRISPCLRNTYIQQIQVLKNVA
jgi:hypothetical protein